MSVLEKSLSFFVITLQNQELLSQMDVILQNARVDSTQLQTKLEGERSQNHELEKKLISARHELGDKATKLTLGLMENAQLRKDFNMVQDSLGSVEESVRNATDTIKSLQQVYRRN